jgi:RNA polymerase sigma-70 factor (ECF subfamily)
MRFVQSIVRNRHDAEDITQAVFIKLMRAIQRYEERQVPFAAWILRVARNAALDHLRSKRQIPVEEVWISDNGEHQSSFDRLDALKAALGDLPQSQRQVLVLRHIGGLSPNEIAKTLGKTEASVQGLHHRGRAALKVSLRERGVAPAARPPAL